MIGESLAAVDPVFRPTNRPIENQAQHRLAVSDAKRKDRAASHTAAHQMRTLDIQVVQQSFALGDVVVPRETFDTASGLTAFAPVENDAAKFFGEVFQNLDPCVNALRRPLLQSCIESGR